MPTDSGNVRSAGRTRSDRPVAKMTRMVESRCGAVALGRTYLLPPLSSDGALVVQPWLRFHIPLIEPDMQISRIRLSGNTSSPSPTPRRAQSASALQALIPRRDPRRTTLGPPPPSPLHSTPPT